MTHELPPGALYPQQGGVMGAAYQLHGVVRCDFCRRYTCGKEFRHFKPYGLGAGTWVVTACHGCLAEHRA